MLVKPMLRTLLFSGVVALSACAGQDGGPSPILTQANTAADSLAAQVRAGNPDPAAAGQILLSSFIDIRNLHVSAPIGAVISEEIGARFTQAGFSVVESRLGGSLIVTERGEYMLSDRARDIATRQSATSVLVGSYAVDGGNVYVTARLVRVQDNIAIGAYSFTVPVSHSMRELLASYGAQTAAPSAISLGRMHLHH